METQWMSKGIIARKVRLKPKWRALRVRVLDDHVARRQSSARDGLNRRCPEARPHERPLVADISPSVSAESLSPQWDVPRAIPPLDGASPRCLYRASQGQPVATADRAGRLGP